jgi:CBS domain-containing protein
MAETVGEVMTRHPVTMESSSTVTDAAKAMKEHDIGALVVTKDGEVRGLVTDRDLVVRALAADRDPGSTKIGDVCSTHLVTLTPTDTIQHAVNVMAAGSLRRLPVVEDARAVGILSIGDVAIERDEHSVLAGISAAPPNH